MNPNEYVICIVSKFIFFNSQHTTEARRLLHASAIRERVGFRCYTANSRPNHQAETCFMLSPEVWLGKPLSQVNLQGQGEKKKKKACLAPVETSWEEAWPQSSLAPGPHSLEPWPPLGHSLPSGLVLRSNINFMELRTPAPAPVRTQRVTTATAREAPNSTRQVSENTTTEKVLSCSVSQGKTWEQGRHPSPNSSPLQKREREAVAGCNLALHEQHLPTQRT